MNMNKKLNKRKEILKKGGETFRTMAAAFFLAYTTMPGIVYADTSYTAPLDKLKNVMISICVAAGAIILIFGGIRFAIAFQKMDQNGEHQAVYTIIAAGVLLGIGAIVSALS